jgi:hypothetical protein
MRTGALVASACAALVLGGAARTASGPALSFAAAKHYAVGASPCSMAIGELSGDGKPDVVTGCDSSVSVLRNHGNGTFEARREYGAGDKPGSVEIADLNGDGKNDLLTAGRDRISVFFNQGAGTFGPPARYALGLQGRDFLQDLLMADLNGDDKPDLVIETGVDFITVSVLLNHGDGTFEPKRDYMARDALGDMAVGDLSGDAKPDLVIVNPYGVSVLINRGDGSFQSGRDYEAPFASRIAVGELNGDGKLDIATASNTGGAWVLLNRGDGTFEAARDYGISSGNQPEPVAIAIADVNGDHEADLVTQWNDVRYRGIHEQNEYVAVVFVLLNKGDGSFFPAHNYELRWEAELFAIADLNGDGKPDLALARSGVNVLLNKGNGSFEPSLRYPLSYAEGEIGSADLNGDGRSDLVGASRQTRHGASRTVSVRLSTPGLCNVQPVRGLTLAAANRRLGRANCHVGKITRVYRKSVARGRVISQKPRFGAVLRGGAKVDLVVSRGKRPAR